MNKLTNEDQLWLDTLYTKLTSKLHAECKRVGDAIPYVPFDGVYTEDKAETDPYWWTNGFWTGILWQMYAATAEPLYRKTAEAVEERLAETLTGFTGLHHDVGFMFLHSSVANYRITGSETAKTRGLHAANLLAGRYNPNGRFIRAWNDWGIADRKTGWMIVDCMMNIPLLYWASEIEADPRFAAIAEAHADTAMRCLVRADGSCNHIACLHPLTGELEQLPGGQGYGEGSAWTRGQAWALYGFALSYHWTGKTIYLKTAKKIAHYFMASAAAHEYRIPSDFRAPAEPVIYDESAAACAACGLLTLSEQVPENEQYIYRKAAAALLQTADEQFCNWDTDTDGILYGCSEAYHGDPKKQHNLSLIYGDYFLLEAVLRLRGTQLMIW